MYKFLVKLAGGGYTTNCVSLGENLNSYAILNNEKHYEPGTVFNFEYTSTVLEVVLYPGRYLLQCWGAQGGNSYQYNGIGSKGGYSEGILTLNTTTTVYIFVGGKGANGNGSTSIANGGWNGGGGSVGKSSYNTDSHKGTSYPACGGGATDIATVTSDMTYSDYHTNRSNASLLSRCIVAGGGAGASARYTEEQVRDENNDRYYETVGPTVDSYDSAELSVYMGSSSSPMTYMDSYITKGTLWEDDLYWEGSFDNLYIPYDSVFVLDVDSTPRMTSRYHITNGKGSDIDVEIYRVTFKTSNSNASSDSLQQGGGTSGRGTSPGTQTSGGGTFGFGKNQTNTNYRYASGAGGGGWYGGGVGNSDSKKSYINNSGGGSGFINIAANASSRPSGYTGLQLDGGRTVSGNDSFPSVNGGNETGHSGNGYARITVLNPDGSGSGGDNTGDSTSMVWATQTGTWNETFNSSAADSKQFTCVSPGSSGSTRLRCTFSGVTSITFKCRYQGESSYDYLTIGKIDTLCSRSSYGTSLKGTSGIWKEVTYTCDSGEHFVEFCYSKDNSVNTSPDNADVYILKYS